MQGRCLSEDNAGEQGPVSVAFEGCVSGRDTLVQCVRYPGAFWVMGQFQALSDVIS